MRGDGLSVIRMSHLRPLVCNTFGNWLFLTSPLGIFSIYGDPFYTTLLHNSFVTLDQGFSIHSYAAHFEYLTNLTRLVEFMEASTNELMTESGVLNEGDMRNVRTGSVKQLQSHKVASAAL